MHSVTNAHMMFEDGQVIIKMFGVLLFGAMIGVLGNSYWYVS